MQHPTPRVNTPSPTPALTVRDGLDLNGLGDAFLRGGLHRLPADFGLEKGIDQGGLPQAALPWGEDESRSVGPVVRQYLGAALSLGPAQWGPKSGKDERREGLGCPGSGALSWGRTQRAPQRS